MAPHTAAMIASFNSRGVSPQLFEAVQVSHFLVEDMHNRVDIIEDDPSSFGLAFRVGLGDFLLFQSETNVLGNRLDVPARGPVADYEIVRNG